MWYVFLDLTTGSYAECAGCVLLMRTWRVTLVRVDTADMGETEIVDTAAQNAAEAGQWPFQWRVLQGDVHWVELVEGLR